MNRKSIWLAIAVMLVAVFILVPASILASDGPLPDGHAVEMQPAFTTITGTIDSKADTIPGEWVIDGTAIMMTAQTRFHGNPVTMNVGDTVKVMAHDDGGVLYGDRVWKLASGNNLVRIQGVISEIADDHWVVDGTEVGVTDATVILGAEPDVGDIADVRAQETADGLIATRIIVVDSPRSVHFTGVIAEMTADVWIISTLAGDQTITITADTVIEGNVPDVDDVIEVWADVTGDGLVATRIVIQDTPTDVLFRGKIREIAEDHWKVGRITVLVNEDTVVEGNEPDVGDYAEVWGSSTPEGLLATRIVVHDKPKAIIVRGELEAIAEDVWTISGVDVTITPDTVILGDPQVGDRVIALGERNGDGTIEALVIHKVPEYPTADAHFSGFIVSIVGPDAKGADQVEPTLWVVQSSFMYNGEALTWDVWITDETDVYAESEPAVGDWVKGIGQENDDGSVTAEIVRVTSPPRVPFMGAIEEQPAEGAIGDWVINGVTVHVSEDARVIGDPADWGGHAKGYGLLQPDGSVEALVIGPMPGYGYDAF